MNNFIRCTYRTLVMFGFDPRKTFRSVKGLPHFFRNLYTLKSQKGRDADEFSFGILFPCLDDRFSESGIATGHYFYQDLLVARRICQNEPIFHVDVGSRIDGFVAHVASFRSIEVFDIRPLCFGIIPNINFRQTNMMVPVDTELTDYCDSLSCLHTIEHFGLGRYGDPVDYDGYLLGIDNLYRILKTGGKLYFSVPIGKPRIEFDAHRVFSVDYLMRLFEGRFRVDYFSFVDDGGRLHEHVTMRDVDRIENFGCTYGCGIFEMTKIAVA